MKKGIKLAALAALVWAVLSCGQGITADGNVVPSSNEDEAVFTGSGIYYYLPDFNTRGSEHETFKYAQKAVTEGKAEYKNGMYISTEYAVKDVSFTFRKDGTYSLKGTHIKQNTNTVIDSGVYTGTYSISNKQLVCVTQYNVGVSEDVYLISNEGEKLVLKSIDTPKQISASGIRPIYSLTQSGGLLTVFSK